ncbi:MAG: VOC family protein [Anaerolineae bacterium]|nr:VOC family protein [Anaerolineae bacterium]
MKHTIVHFEIPADDMARAKAFYEALFGWKIELVPDFGGYHSVMTSDSDTDVHGGMMQRQNPGHVFVTYVSTASVDESVAKLEALGGTVVIPKMPIPGMGWFAEFRDPEGNLMGLFQEDPAAA